MLEGDDAASAVVYACGPPAMLEAVRAMCAERGVACELAMESPMACGFGACFGCAVPLRRGRLHAPLRRRAGRPRGRSRPRWSPERALSAGPARRALRHRAGAPGPQRSGTFDAIAARRVYGDALLEASRSAAFVSKTITPEPRAGNPPPRLWETPAGMINSIGLPNKGLEGFLAEDLPQLAELPVPLIVSVMGRARRSSRAWSRASAARDEVAALELNVSCPNVHSGLIVGEQPDETRGAAGGAAPADREAADREADAQRRRPRGGRGRRGGGGRRRRLADQHAEGERDRPGHRTARLGGRQRRPLRPGGAADRGAQVAPSRPPSTIPVSGWEESRPAPMRSNSSPPGRRGGGRHRELPRPAGRRAGRARSSPRATRDSSTSDSSPASTSTRGRGEFRRKWRRMRLARASSRGYTRRPHARPSQDLRTRPPRGRWTSGWTRSSGRTTSAPPGPS